MPQATPQPAADALEVRDEQDTSLHGRRVLFLSSESILAPPVQSQGLPHMRELHRRFGVDFTYVSIDMADSVGAGTVAGQEMQERCRSWGIEWRSIPHAAVRCGSTLDVVRGIPMVLGRAWRNRVDLVHCRGPAPSQMMVLSRLLCRVPSLYDMRSPYADERVRDGAWAANSSRYRVTLALENAALRAADGVIVVTDRQYDNVRGRWRPGRTRDALADKITVIRNCVDTAAFRPDDVQAATQRRQMGLADRVVVLWVLSIVRPVHMPQQVAALFRAFLTIVPSAVLVIATREPGVEEWVRRQGIPDGSVRVLSLPGEQVPGVMRAADAGIALIDPRHDGPGIKLAEYLASGLPVVTSPCGPESDLVARERVGFVARDLSDEAIAELAARVAEGLREGAPLRERCRAAGVRFYSLDTAVEQYAEVYRRILNR